MEGIQIVDRYDALRMERPDPATMCEGQCEGIGVYPVYDSAAHLPAEGQCYPAEPNGLTEHEQAEVERIATENGPADDGWYFVRCGDCGGSGKRAA